MVEVEAVSTRHRRCLASFTGVKYSGAEVEHPTSYHMHHQHGAIPIFQSTIFLLIGRPAGQQRR